MQQPKIEVRARDERRDEACAKWSVVERGKAGKRCVLEGKRTVGEMNQRKCAKKLKERWEVEEHHRWDIVLITKKPGLNKKRSTPLRLILFCWKRVLHLKCSNLPKNIGSALQIIELRCFNYFQGHRCIKAPKHADCFNGHLWKTLTCSGISWCCVKTLPSQ